MPKLKDITGQKFGKLTALKRVNNDKQNCVCYLCKCDCGKEVIVRSSSLKNGNTQSCGCLQKQTAIIISKENFTKHNLCNHRIYKIYRNMKRRCFNKNDKAYKNYGGRGIIIYQKWLDDFETFYNWAIQNGYKEYLTIDRIDVNGNYEPNNCRWVDMKTQSRNRRNNHLLTYNDKTLCISEWAEKLNCSRALIQHRLNRGWDIEKTLTTYKLQH